MRPPSLRFTTTTTPTTNILFGNFQTGFGEIDFGLGALVQGLDIDPAELGHFVTISATFVPEPASICLWTLGLALLTARGALTRHRRRR